jgi:hypothetical protein
MNHYKIIALVIFLILIVDVFLILYINGFKPTITSMDVKDEANKVKIRQESILIKEKYDLILLDNHLFSS